MNYQEIKEQIFALLLERGFLPKGKNCVYKKENDAIILVKPRKHTISETIFFVDYGVLLCDKENTKVPGKTEDCHLEGEFSNIVNRLSGDYIAWDTDNFDSEKMKKFLDEMILPYIYDITKIDFLKKNYPYGIDNYMANATSIKSHEFLMKLAEG